MVALVTAATPFAWYQFFILLSSHCYDQKTQEKQPKGRMIYFWLRFGGFSPWSLDLMCLAVGACERGELLTTWKTGERDRERDQGQDTSPRITPSDLLLPDWFHLLKFPEPSQIAQPTGDQAPNTWALWGDTLPPNHGIIWICSSVRGVLFETLRLLLLLLNLNTFPTCVLMRTSSDPHGTKLCKPIIWKQRKNN